LRVLVSPRSRCFPERSIPGMSQGWAGLHQVAVLLLAWGPKGLCGGAQSHQGAAPEQGAAEAGSNHRGTGGEGGAQCHILGQSVPISTMSSATVEVSPVKSKEGGLQTLGQTCLIIGQKAESQNHRMVGVGRDLWGSSSPTLLPKQGHLQ